MENQKFRVAGLAAKRERLRAELAATERALNEQIAADPKHDEICAFISRVVSEGIYLSEEASALDWATQALAGSLNIRGDDGCGVITVQFIDLKKVQINLSARELLLAHGMLYG